MSNIEQTKLDKLLDIAKALDEKIEKIRLINQQDMMTLTENEILEIQQQKEDDQ